MHTPQDYTPGRLHGTPAMLVMPSLPTDIYTEKTRPDTYVLTQTSSTKKGTTRRNTYSKTGEGVGHMVTTYPVNRHVRKNYFLNHPPCMALFSFLGTGLFLYFEPYSAKKTKAYVYYYFLTILFISRFWYL